ncbi:MAG: hypothetical protein PHQ11_09880 [Paludibacter sp.]|nr:hypothetical protein [Paludibacter sp.]MDD4428938.1 hypothetical protein [Paludibacter sp.]
MNSEKGVAVLNEFRLYVTISKKLDYISVWAGAARAKIRFSNDIYTITPDSTVLCYVDKTDAALKLSKENQIRKEYLTPHPKDSNILLVKDKIKCICLSDALNIIIGKEHPIPYNSFQSLPDSKYQYSIALTDTINGQLVTRDLCPVTSKKTRQRTIKELTISTKPNPGRADSWIVTCGNLISTVKLLYMSNLVYVISKGSKMLNRDFGLPEEILSTRKKLLDTGQIKLISSGVYTVVKPLRIPNQQTVLQILTGYPIFDMIDAFDDSEKSWTYTIDEAAPSENQNYEANIITTILPQPIAILKNPEDNEFMVGYGDAVSTVRCKREVYSLLSDSTISAVSSSSSEALLKHKNDLLTAGVLQPHPDNFNLLVVTDKIRFQSLNSLLEMVTGKICDFPYNTYEELPDSYNYQI